jgi:3-hydroxyisobutyrate dehydrogenase-like beta-hydroxyacid dehydrogenase
MNGTIGIAGVGRVGSALAATLSAAGQEVLLLPPRSGGLKPALSHLPQAASARELAARCDVLLTCLRNSEETEALMPDFLAGGAAKSGFIHIDHCNGDPARDRAFAEAWLRQGGLFTDAALLGPPERLPAAKPKLIVGGSEDAFQRVREIAPPYCDDFVHAGPVGNGHLLRLIISLMGYGIAALSAEIIATAGASGIGPELVRAALSGKGSDSDTFQAVVAAAISPQAEKRQLPLSNIRRDLDRLADVAPAAAPQDFMGTALRDFFARADSSDGEAVMASDLTSRLSTPPFLRGK